MKKIIPLLLIAALLLGGCAEERSRPRKEKEPDPAEQVEAMIEGLGTITLDSIDEIRSIQAAVDALTDNQMNQVSNLDALGKAQDRWYELSIMGQWCQCDIPVRSLYPGTVDVLCAVDLELKDDMTYAATLDNEDTAGAWYVSGGVLYLEELGWGGEMEIREQEDGFSLYSWTYGNFCAPERIRQRLDEMFLEVDLTEVDPAEYIKFTSYESTSVDEWGDPSGWSYEYLAMESRIYDQGWVYLSCSDYLVNVTIPAHTITYTYPDGGVEKFREEERVYTHNWDPFGTVSCWFAFKTTAPEYASAVDVTPDQFSISRIKGKLLFISSAYAAVREEDGSRYVDVSIDGDSHSYYMGGWIEGVDY